MNLGDASPHRKLDTAVAGGLAWTVGVKALTQFFTWASLLVVAHLLSPADYGLVNMAASFSMLTRMVGEFGIGQAVLQMPELQGRQLAQLNTACVALTTAAYAFTVLTAPLVAIFFKSSQLTPLIAVNSLGLILTGFHSVSMGLLEREMNYRRLSVAEAAQVTVQALATLILAWFGFAYWSLVVGILLGQVATTILLVWWNPVPFAWPRWEDMRAPLRLGGHLSVSRLAASAYILSDGIVVGRRLGDTALGTYQWAMNLATAPYDKISALIMRVTGPLFAKVQNDNDLVRRYFRIVTEVLGLSIFPLGFGLALVAPDAVRVLLGKSWTDAAGPLRWLALFVGIRALSPLFSQVLLSLRYARFNMWVSLLNFAVMPLAFFIASRWSTSAVAACWLILAPITIFPSAIKVLRVIGFGFGEFLATLAPALLGSAVMLAAAWLAGVTVSQHGAVVRLVAQTLTGGAAYGGFLWLFYRERLTRYARFVTDLRRGTPLAPVDL